MPPTKAQSPRASEPGGSGRDAAAGGVERTLIVVNASEVCVPEAGGRGVERLPRHALAIAGGRVRWLGPEHALPESHADGADVFDAAGGAVLPALVDCHTHLIFGGDRVEDFSRRTRGMSYAEIAAEGGGILTTVRATRAASNEALLEQARARLLTRAERGIGTTEIKSGYGLTVEHEIRMLEIAAQLRQEGFDIESTLLAAHAVPKDIAREVYLQQIIELMIPEVASRKLARFVDVFVEKGAYTVEEGRQVFEAGKRHGLIPRLHADQITAGCGAELAAHVSAVSADHLEHASDQGLDDLAKARVVATLLPGALTYLGDEAPRLGRRMIAHGVEVAVATDQNPGSSPTSNLALMATLACTRMGLTVEEALRAITLGGAHALGREDVGTLRPGARGRFLVLDHPDSRALVAAYGEPVVRTAFVG